MVSLLYTHTFYLSLSVSVCPDISQMHLPDMELVVNLGDWPLNNVARMPVFPVLSWCGSPDTRDIVWPTWDIMKSTVMGLER